jgi:hypothetical protein
VLRDVIVTETDDEALAYWADSAAFVGHNWFEPFGFSAGLAHPTRESGPTCSARG